MSSPSPSSSSSTSSASRKRKAQALDADDSPAVATDARSSPPPGSPAAPLKEEPSHGGSSPKRPKILETPRLASRPLPPSAPLPSSSEPAVKMGSSIPLTSGSPSSRPVISAPLPPHSVPFHPSSPPGIIYHSTDEIGTHRISSEELYKLSQRRDVKQYVRTYANLQLACRDLRVPISVLSDGELEELADPAVSPKHVQNMAAKEIYRRDEIAADLRGFTHGGADTPSPAGDADHDDYDSDSDAENKDDHGTHSMFRVTATKLTARVKSPPSTHRIETPPSASVVASSSRAADHPSLTGGFITKHDAPSHSSSPLLHAHSSPSSPPRPPSSDSPSSARPTSYISPSASLHGYGIIKPVKRETDEDYDA